MVYRVTLKHAMGKATNEQVMELIRRADPEGSIEELRVTNEGIVYRVDGSSAMVENSPGEITITPGTQRSIALARLAEMLILPGPFVNAWNRRNHSQAMQTAAMASIAGMGAQPANSASDLFPDVTPEQWAQIRADMGVTGDLEMLPAIPIQGRPEQELMTLAPSMIVPQDHWLPPQQWGGIVDESGIEWINYPEGTPQYFKRQSGTGQWSIHWDIEKHMQLVNSNP